MTKTFKRIIITGIVFIAIAAGAVALVMTGGCSSNASSPISGFTNGALNTVIDITGVKGHVDSLLREKAGSLAEEWGVSQSVAEEVIDSLAIEDWRVTSLPADAVKTGTSTVRAKDVDVTITTYEDPGILTVGAYGFSLTMEVPESAELYTPFLNYIQYFQE